MQVWNSKTVRLVWIHDTCRLVEVPKICHQTWPPARTHTWIYKLSALNPIWLNLFYCYFLFYTPFAILIWLKALQLIQKQIQVSRNVPKLQSVEYLMVCVGVHSHTVPRSLILEVHQKKSGLRFIWSPDYFFKEPVPVVATGLKPIGVRKSWQILKTVLFT